jgi:hypothetical protein
MARPSWTIVNSRLDAPFLGECPAVTTMHSTVARRPPSAAIRESRHSGPRKRVTTAVSVPHTAISANPDRAPPHRVYNGQKNRTWPISDCWEQDH